MAKRMPDILSESEIVSREHAGDAGRRIRRANENQDDLKPYLRRFETLKDERRPMEPIYREIQKFLMPDAGRFLDGDAGDPNRENPEIDLSNIFDSTPIRAADTAASGLHGGLTSPSTQWFTYFVGDYEDFRDRAPQDIKDWTLNAQKCVRDIMSNSNFYAAIQRAYREEIGCATAVMMGIQDDYTIARYKTLTMGEYWLGAGDDGRIHTLYRKVAKTAHDIVSAYGKDRSPRRVLETLDKNPDLKFFVIQAIQPWDYFGNMPSGERRYRYEDVRWVEGCSQDDPILYRGGYVTRPFVAVRWADSGDSVYGRSSPGIMSLPDNMQLQLLAAQINKNIDWQIDPAWAIHESAKESLGKGIRPGSIVSYSGDPRAAMVSPIMPASLVNLENAMIKQQDLRQMARDAHFNQYFALIQDKAKEMTTTEIMQLVQEKSDLLGPVVTQNMSELLIPILDRTFEIAVDIDMLPPAPEAIQGRALRPYFMSSLAIAQKQASRSGDSIFLQWLTAAAQMDPTVLDGVNFDAWRNAYAEDGTIQADIILGDDEIEAVRQQKLEQQQQASQMEQMAQAGSVAQSLGRANITPDTALGQLMGTGQQEEAPV